MLSVARVRLHLLTTIAVLGTPTVAYAADPQTAPATVAQSGDEQAATEQTPTESNDGGIAEVVVTATKRETNLQKTPIAINVLSAPILAERHVQSLYDLADGAVPSLRVTTFEARQSALTIGIRGIVPLDANQPAREQGVGIYIDGVYLGRQHGLNAALFDVERVEVLKGPQGTLFGRNTEGGALSIVSKTPSGRFQGRVRGGVGNLGAYHGDAHLDLPEFANISIKLDGVIQYQGPATENPLAGQVGWGYFDRKAGRVAARWRPFDGLTNDFSFDYGNDKNSPFYSQLLNVNPNNCAPGAQSASPNCVLPGTDYTQLTGTLVPPLPGVVVEGQRRMRVADIGVPQQASVDKTHGFTNILKYVATPEIELRSITSWRGVDVDQWDNAGGAHRVPLPRPGCQLPTPAMPNATACNFSRYSIAGLKQNQFSQELQAVGTVGSVDYVAGLYYFNERVSDDAATPNSMRIVGYTTPNQLTGFRYEPLDPCTGSGGFGWQAGCRSIDRASAVRSKSYAVYGQATWHATDVLHLTAGGRYTHDKKRGELLFSRGAAYGPISDNLRALARPGFVTLTPAELAAAGYQPLDESWDRFNPMATIAYDVTPDVHVYAKYATGYRAGGASSRTSNYQAFDPEDVRSYEVGMKSEFWNRRARFNLAGYIMDRDDSQVDISAIQVTGTGSFNNLVTINAPGTTKIRGIEADFTLNPIQGLSLNASYAYTYTKIPPVDIVNSVTVNGVTTTTTVPQQFFIVFTPRNAASGSIDYALPVGDTSRLSFHFDGNYAQATQTFDQFATKNDGSLIFNGRIALTDIRMSPNGQALTLALWGRNLFNEQYVYRRDPSNSLPATPTTNVRSGSIANVLGDYGNFNPPRTYGIEASIKF